MEAGEAKFTLHEETNRPHKSSMSDYKECFHSSSRGSNISESSDKEASGIYIYIYIYIYRTSRASDFPR